MLSLNARGLRNTTKLKKVLNWSSKHGGESGVRFLQESHTISDMEQKWQLLTKGEFIMSHGTSNSRGVAIHIGQNLEYQITSRLIDSEGRYILFLVKIQGSDFLLINSYAPNNEQDQVIYFRNLFDQISTIDCPLETHIVWGGDFNVIFDLDLEASGGNPSLKLNSVEDLLN